jgi:hypothetical protein
MNPRKPGNGPQEDVQNEVPQAIHEAPDDCKHAPSHPDPVNLAPLKAQQEEALKTQIERDRVEIYLKGPTVFTA